MAVEAATTINQLDATKPGINDLKSEGDDHIRLLKSTIKATFPNVTGAVTPTHTQLNFVTGVTSAIQTQIDTKAPIASPTFTGTPAAPTAAASTNTTQIATTAFVQGELTVKAPIASPTFTGTPTAPTPATADNTTKLATTAHVQAVFSTVPAGALPAVAGNAGKVLTVNGTEDGVEWAGGGLDVFAYDNRALLRAVTATAGDQAIVEGLGLFVWEAGSTEPDDDESCFATASGRWLLEAAHWDLVDSWQAPDDQVIEDFQLDEPLRFASRVLTGSAVCAITSVAATSSTSFTGTVTGAAIGDRVVATPPTELGATNAESGRLSYHAWVSAADTVTVMLTNASAASATTNTAIRAAWPLTVIKS